MLGYMSWIRVIGIRHTYITKSHAAVPVGDNPNAAVAVPPVAPLVVEAPHLHSHMLELPQMCNELPHMLNELLN